MDNSTGDDRRDWNQEVFDLYAGQADQGKEQWQETRKKRLKNTKPSLPKASYTGTYTNPSFGEIRIEMSGSNMTLKTAQIDFEMSHWHLDTYLVEYKTWEMHEFATFNINPEGSLTSVDVIGHTFERVPTE